MSVGIMTDWMDFSRNLRDAWHALSALASFIFEEAVIRLKAEF